MNNVVQLRKITKRNALVNKNIYWIKAY